MNRRSTFLVRLSFLLLLSLGLGSLSLANTSSTSFPVDVFHGVLKEAGPSIFMEASHELIGPQGQVKARVSGLDYRLDLKRFEGKAVELTGHFRPTVEHGGRIFEVHSIKLLPRPQPSPSHP